MNPLTSGLGFSKNAMSSAMLDATSAATWDAMSMSMSLMVEHVALFATISVTFIFVIDIGLGLG